MSTSQLLRMYERGENIMQYLSDSTSPGEDSFDLIQMAYEIQAGSYTELSSTPEGQEIQAAFTDALEPYVLDHGFTTILDAGVGEGTTLSSLLPRIPDSLEVFAYDSSVSRLNWANMNLASTRHKIHLFVADTSEIPLPDASVDLVISVHSLEPNGGREEPLLSELLRVTSRRLLLVEPTTEFASQRQRARMEEHGYVRDLASTLRRLGVEASVHVPWEVNWNPDNMAELIIVDMPPSSSAARADRQTQLVSPVSLTPLRDVGSGLYSDTDGLFFPIIRGMPVLLRSKAVFVARMP